MASLWRHFAMSQNNTQQCLTGHHCWEGCDNYNIKFHIMLYKGRDLPKKKYFCDFKGSSLTDKEVTSNKSTSKYIL